MHYPLLTKQVVCFQIVVRSSMLILIILTASYYFSRQSFRYSYQAGTKKEEERDRLDEERFDRGDDMKGD